MTVHLILRFADGTQRPGAAERLAWLAVGTALLLLSLVTALGCTSGGGPAPAQGQTSNPPPPAYAPSATFVEANGGDQRSGDGTLDNQGIFSQDLSLKASKSADGTLQNQTGFNPTVAPPGGF